MDFLFFECYLGRHEVNRAAPKSGTAKPNGTVASETLGRDKARRNRRGEL